MVIRRRSAGLILFLMILFILTAFALLSVREGQFDLLAVILGIAVSLLILLQYHVMQAFFRHLDRFVLLMAEFLCSIGMIVLYLSLLK